MTDSSGALDNPNFDCNTFSLECEDSKYIYISVLEIFEFRTSDKIIDYISLTGNNLTPYVFAMGPRYTYFISTYYKFIENDKIEEGTLLNSSNDSLDPSDYHLSKNGLDCFKKLLECNRIHKCWPGVECGFMEEEEGFQENVEEDVNIHELEHTDGINEVAKFFNQNCVLCVERDSDYLFKYCDHQCICEECYQNRGNIDILKCIICRT